MITQNKKSVKPHLLFNDLGEYKEVVVSIDDEIPFSGESGLDYADIARRDTVLDSCAFLLPVPR